MTSTALALLLAAQAGGDYLPLEPGTRWTYEVTSESSQAPAEPGEAREVVARVVEAAAPAGDGWVEMKDFLGYATSWVRSTDGAVELRAEAGEAAPVLALLTLPARAGDTWTGALGREAVVFTVGGEQPLDDGRRALRVDFTVAAPEKHAGHAGTRGALWFERGTGLVKASLIKDLDCHTASTTVYRLKR